MNDKKDGNIRTGKKGEDIAVAYLKTKGYRIIERNYRCMFGEMDIVAEEAGTVVFIEVKSRRSDIFGEPQFAVGSNKQRKLSKIAIHYLKGKNRYPGNARFDVVAVKIDGEGNHVDIIRDAFDLAF